MMSVDVHTQPTFLAGTPRLLFAAPLADVGGSYWSNYDVSRTGQEFLMLQAAQTSTPRINVLVNWNALVK